MILSKVLAVLAFPSACNLPRCKLVLFRITLSDLLICCEAPAIYNQLNQLTEGSGSHCKNSGQCAISLVVCKRHDMTVDD